MTAGPEWLAALLALVVALVTLALVAAGAFRALRDIRRECAKHVALLGAIEGELIRARGGGHHALSQVLLEGALHELRRLAGLTQASLEGSLRELRRAADSTQATLAAGADVARQPMSDPPPAASSRPTPVPTPTSSAAALVVVRRDQPKLYELLRETADQVVWDRRQVERRVRRVSLATERRRRERRRRPPATWETLGFILATRPRTR